MSRINWHLALGAFVVLAIIIALYSVSFARDNGQWEGTDPAVRDWYQHLMMPDLPNSPCCGEADAYWCDDYYSRDGKAYCKITDDRNDALLMRPHIDVGTEIEIPPNKLKWGPHDPQQRTSINPTGHNILFVSRGLYTYCFVESGGV